MSTPLACLGIATLLAYLPRLAAKVRPASAERLDPLARDGFEALVAFGVAVAAAQIGDADPHRASILSIAFVVTRGGWLAAHAVRGVEYLRGALWSLALLLCAALFGLPLLA